MGSLQGNLLPAKVHADEIAAIANTNLWTAAGPCVNPRSFGGTLAEVADSLEPIFPAPPSFATPYANWKALKTPPAGVGDERGLVTFIREGMGCLIAVVRL